MKYLSEKAGNTINPDYVMIGLKKNGTIVYPYGIPVSMLRSSNIRNGSKLLIHDSITLTQSGSNYIATDNYQLYLWLDEDYEMPSDGSIESYSVTVNVNSNVGAIGGVTTKYAVSNTLMNIGSTLPNGVNGRDTAALAMNDWVAIAGSTRPFYLKHILNGSNEIEESYVEFVVTSDMVTANPGMVAGTYTLKGGDYGASYASNVNTIKTAFGYSSYPSRCYDDTASFRCSVSGLRALTYDDGYVGAYVDDGCYVNDDGSSRCRGDGEGSGIN